MATAQYLFLSNAWDSQGAAWKERFVASDNPANDALLRTEASRTERARVRTAVHARGNLLDPSQWIVVDVGLDPANIPTSAITPRVSAFLARNLPYADQFVHWADVSKARAHLARATYYSCADYAGMAYVDAAERLMDAWRALGRYFRALNLHPYTLQFYRRAWEKRAQCYRRYCVRIDNDTSFCSTQYLVGTYANPSIPLQPMPQAEDATPNFDPHGFTPSNGDQATWPIAFATGAADWRKTAAAAVAGDARFPPYYDGDLGNVIFVELGWPTATRCPNGGAPQDAHRYWLDNSGSALGTPGTPDDIRAAYGHDEPVGWTTWWVGKGPTESVSGEVDGASTIAGVPSLAAYHELLSEICAYLLARHPLAVVQEARVDMLGRNLWMAEASGQSVGQLSILGTLAQLKGSAAVHDGNVANANLTSQILRAAGAAFSAIPIYGQIIAGVLGTISAVVNLSAALQNTVIWVPMDMFGQKLPIVDALGIVDTEAAGSVATIIPDFPAGTWPTEAGPLPGEPGAWTGAVAIIGNPTDGTSSVLGLIPDLAPNTGSAGGSTMIGPVAMFVTSQQPGISVRCPVPGTTVTIPGIYGGATQRVPFDGMADPGSYTVTVNVPGYRPYVVPVTVTPDGLADLFVDPHTLIPAASPGLQTGAVVALATALGGFLLYRLWRRAA